ncbi:hypothetical protein M407DRAFT_240431 [Tulasnella calospora MUT 4182]|uniref:Uncharacterized protein n=1 Tax=Tulasnella calospora MUT 4182 TaxID=1051891 RepID=A0A0C3QN27_9AGAM|nr:hypothetical protein M407DRAFT_240431 [Tulasnella calospora MUT 4182]
MKRQRIDDAQTSLQLDPSQIGPNLALTGQEVPAAGQVPSLTSTNNYINFCLTQNTELTNGKQITTGSCNQTPMGRIIATDKMPVSRFTFPSNGGAIAENTSFTIKMAVVNIDAGHFTNPTVTYYNAPQTVNNNGVGVGHTHCVIEKISAFDTEDVPDPRNFAFFKGLNAAADANGQLTADVTGGLPVGFYKLTSINTASNHMPFLVAVAQHGTSDDSIYFEVTADGKPSAANIAANPPSTAGVDTNASASIAATASATASSVASASVSANDAAVTSTASAASESATGKGAAETKDAVTASAAETKAASSTEATSAAASTSSAAADKGNKDKNDKKDAESSSVVASTPAATSSTPAKGAAATSAAASSESVKETSSATVSSSAASSTATASEETATGKSDNKGKDKN